MLIALSENRIPNFKVDDRGVPDEIYGAVHSARWILQQRPDCRGSGSVFELRSGPVHGGRNRCCAAVLARFHRVAAIAVGTLDDDAALTGWIFPTRRRKGGPLPIQNVELQKAEFDDDDAEDSEAKLRRESMQEAIRIGEVTDAEGDAMKVSDMTLSLHTLGLRGRILDRHRRVPDVTRGTMRMSSQDTLARTVATEIARLSREALDWINDPEENDEKVAARKKELSKAAAQGRAAGRAALGKLGADEDERQRVRPQPGGQVVSLSRSLRGPRMGGLWRISPIRRATLDYISQINPAGDGESTGLVTRFTMSKDPTPQGFPDQAEPSDRSRYRAHDHQQFLRRWRPVRTATRPEFAEGAFRCAFGQFKSRTGRKYRGCRLRRSMRSPNTSKRPLARWPMPLV